MARYCIGIDLGTTNCSLAYTEISDEPAVELASIPQLVSANEVAAEPLLPSFLYIPGERDFPKGSIALPWDDSPQYVTGKLAQRRGARVPGGREVGLHGPHRPDHEEERQAVHGEDQRGAAQLLDELVTAIKQVAEEELITFADLFSWFSLKMRGGYDEQSFLWSDMLHYRKTTTMARNLFLEAQRQFDEDGDQDKLEQFQAFALGWVAHLGTDTIDHSFVNEQSGGPFRTASAEILAVATPAQAVAHPNWTMGAKISVDSATLMNKGLELIEAHYLFVLPSSRIDVLIHPQSVVHSMVEFVDGSVLAQLGSPDMRIPIAYALAWPDRIETPAQRLDLAAVARLDFESPDLIRFPALRLAREALEIGGAAPIVLNAANEMAVARFLSGGLRFPDIAVMVEQALERSDFAPPRSIEDVLEIDRATRLRIDTLMTEACH